MTYTSRCGGYSIHSNLHTGYTVLQTIYRNSHVQLYKTVRCGKIVRRINCDVYVLSDESLFIALFHKYFIIKAMKSTDDNML